MMKIALAWVGFLLCFWLLFLVITLPAGHAWHWLQVRGTLPVSLYHLDGSVWRGRALQAVVDDVTLGRVDWRLRPAALLRGRIELDIAIARDNGRLDSIAGLRRDGALYLRDARLGMPLSEAARLAGGVDLGLNGRLEADLARVELGAGGLTHAEGVIGVRNAGLGAPMDFALGDFRLTLTTTDGVINGIIDDGGDGPIDADGTLVLQADGRYRIELRLAARDGADSELRQGLAMIGRADARGRVTVVQEGRIELPGR